MRMSPPSRRGFVPVAVVVLALAAGRGARADVIDGDWCSADGRSFSIRGPQIVTPAGTHTHGAYTRHSFSYVVPPADPEAGRTINMILMNETTVHLWIDAAPARGAAPMEVWHKCPPPVSRAGPARGPRRG